MDIIYLHGLKVDCVIGVWEWKAITQTVTIDLDMGFDISVAAKSDHLQDTVSYKQFQARAILGQGIQICAGGKAGSRNRCHVAD